MSGIRAVATLLCATVVLALAARPSEAQPYGHHHGYRPPPPSHHHSNDWHHQWENRRDARRAGVVAGVIAAGVVGAVEQGKAEQRYADCMYATGYNYECDRRRFDDEMRARENARRAAVLTGIAAYAVTRD